MTLYITENCKTCSEIREALDATAIAHETVVVPQQGRSERLSEGTQPPVLVDDEKVIQGSNDVFAYIDQLKGFKADWLKYQSDVCYAD
jgi:glutaredoxin